MSKFSENYKIIVDHERRVVKLKCIGENYLCWGNLHIYSAKIDYILYSSKDTRGFSHRFITLIEEFMKQFPEYLL